MKIPFLTLLVPLVLWHGTLTVSAQGAAFTYQGRLADNGLPANNNYDFQFTLYDAATDGQEVGPALTINPVVVSNGLFIVTLNFGKDSFPGAARWLEIAVRLGGSAAARTVLNPRHAIAATPYAITASSVTGPINGGLITAGSITGTQLAAGAVTAASIATNSISGSQLAAGAAAANLNAAGQSGVASGGLVLSPEGNTALLNAGYVQIGSIPIAESWRQRVNGEPPWNTLFPIVGVDRK